MTNPARSDRKPRRFPRLTARTADPHILYERAVQVIDADIDFAGRIYRSHNGRPFRRLREDFCGTAAIASLFVRRHPANRAWGVDLHGPTLDWGLREHVSRMKPKERERLVLLQENVMTAAVPPVDVTLALNFSYSVFHTREKLRNYFRVAHDGLAPGGIFITDIFGGTESMIKYTEKRPIAAGHTVEGDPLPPFGYEWEQSSFNVVDHRIVCHINFRFRDGTRLDHAYSYDWRLWTVPELVEVMTEAGFRKVETYFHGWEEPAGTGDGNFRHRKRFENAESWLAFVVGVK